MKLKVGGKYRMKDYPGDYEYVHIICMEKDFGLDDGKSYYNDKENGVDQYCGVIVYDSGYKLNRMPDLCNWGEDGSWDGAFLDDCNAIVSEVEQ